MAAGIIGGAAGWALCVARLNRLDDKAGIVRVEQHTQSGLRQRSQQL